LAMRFQLWQCDFSFGNAFSALAMRFQLWYCDFSFGFSFSISTQLQYIVGLAISFQLYFDKSWYTYL
jgi:hypothetical protein